MRSAKLLAAVFVLTASATFAQQPAPQAVPAHGGGNDAVAQSLAQTEKQLHQQEQLLRQQEQLLRQLQEQLTQQAREIEALRLRLAGTAVPDAATTSARLNAAAAALTPATPATQQAAKNAGKGDAAPLFFRIGNATFTPSGWIDFTGYYRSTNVGSGVGTNFASIPYGSSATGQLSETRFSAQGSRIGMKVDETVGPVKAYGYLEADFYGYLAPNAYVGTNSNTLRMRVYYLNLAYGKWEMLGGQGWSLLTPLRKGLSPFTADIFNTIHIDTNYQVGLPYARQTLLRFVYHPTDTLALGLSVENSEQYSASSVTLPALFPTTETDQNSSTLGAGTATPNAHPDVVAKLTWDPKIGGLKQHIGIAGLLTPVRIGTPVSITKTTRASDMHEGGAVVGNLNLELFKGLHLLSIGTWSDGGGRYIGGLGPGFVVLQPGSATSPFQAALLHSGSGIGGFEWSPNARNTFSALVSAAYFQRRYGLDPSVSSTTYVGYGFPGSATSNNRVIEEASFGSTTTLWKSANYGALQLITQSSYVRRSPWSVPTKGSPSARTFMEFTNLRFVLP